MPGASQWPAFTSTVFLVGCHSRDVVATHYGRVVTLTALSWLVQLTNSNSSLPPLQPLLSPFIPVPGYLQHLLMPAADPHQGDTLNGSLIRILVTLGHASQHGNTVTSFRTGFQALASLPFLKHAHS